MFDNFNKTFLPEAYKEGHDGGDIARDTETWRLNIYYSDIHNFQMIQWSDTGIAGIIKGYSYVYNDFVYAPWQIAGYFAHKDGFHLKWENRNVVVQVIQTLFLYHVYIQLRSFRTA